jgi:hypothetical protein
MTAGSPLVLVLSDRPQPASFLVPPRSGDWFDLIDPSLSTVDYVLCEDISGWPPDSVQHRLGQIRQVLRPAGALRVVTTDVDEMIFQYLLGKVAGQDGVSACAQFNQRLQQLGDGFVYNEQDLTDALMRAGFVDIQRMISGASAHEIFWKTVDEDSRALVVEARRPWANP